jgi:hypothetical protein
MPDAREDDVKFKLVYDGPLPPEGRGRADVKQGIRVHFHPQLVKLWNEHPALREMMVPDPRVGNRRIVDEIGDDYAKGPHPFVPLIRAANQMACRLDIQVLLRKEPYQVFSGDERGDLDNRIKTLIDGLRMPRVVGEMGGIFPTADQKPFFCLLEDDKAVYEFNVKADQLLAGPAPGQQERDVVAIIGVHVTTNERHEIALLSPFGFDRVKALP